MQEGELFRAPEFSLSSLEAYGINVRKIVANTPLKYVNGNDSVPYFGMVLLREDPSCFT
ncbi:MAG: hypothetical protein J6B54_05915 [Clostridia bacterium]|nr:hypothetical protein [Clostridia bacterium]